MNHAASLGAVWALGLFVAGAGSTLDSLLITSVGLLAVSLMLATGVAVWTTDLLDGPPGPAGRPDHVEK
ncbi:hypothetical protein [Halorarius halobius]|uniref:hypothetical protein n=1 Tax=Halorarius halobius TaxID=2962671 RepID=UPI0020CDBA2F|nr:hypothetical protein [Halorarius halobius]